MPYNSTLKAALQAAITTPANPKISGTILQQQLLAILNSMEVGAVFMGTATPATSPTGEANCFYFANIGGNYQNFLDENENTIVVYDGELTFLKSVIVNNNLRWEKISTKTQPFLQQTTKTYNVSNPTALTEPATLPTGWSADAVNGYIHTGGSGTDTTLELTPVTGFIEEGDKYIVKYKISTKDGNGNTITGATALTWMERYFTIGIGTSILVDSYFGNPGQINYIGFKALEDDGVLKLVATTSFVGRIYDIELVKIVEEGGTPLEFNVLNVYNNSMSNDITNSWSVVIGVKGSTMANAENGSRNVAIGRQALNLLKTGNRNIAIGTFALDKATEAYNNIAIGADAGFNTPIANGNVVVGRGALACANVTECEENVAIGKGALTSDYYAKCSHNIAIGSSTAHEVPSSSDVKYNVLIGDGAGLKAVNTNVCIGKSAGATVTRGSNGSNICIGTNSGAGNADTKGEASWCILLGQNANISTSNVSYGIAVGFGSLVKVTEGIAIGKSARSVGTKSIAIGSTANDSVDSGDYSIALGSSSKASGNYAIAIGNGVNAANANSIAIGRNAATSADNQIVIGNPNKIGGVTVYNNMQFALGTGGTFVFNIEGTLYQLVFDTADNVVKFTDITPAP